MKNFLITLAATIITGSTVFGGNSNIIFNGNSVPLETPVKIVENRSYVPLREIGENILEAEVNWDASTKSAILNKNGITIVVPVGSSYIQINGILKPVEYPAFVENGKTYVPVRAIAEGFNYTVGYNNGTITIADYILPQFSDVRDNETIAIMHTNYGDIKLRFFPEYAPKAVENFLTHAQDGYYDGLTFHRVINNFMIQSGDPTGTGAGGESIWGTEFENEVTPELRHFRGALAMANAGPNTNGSQFFIVQNKSADEILNALKKQASESVFNTIYPENIVDAYENHGGYPSLDFSYTVFGQVIEGMDVVDKIAAVQTNSTNKPIEDIIITSIDIQ